MQCLETDSPEAGQVAMNHKNFLLSSDGEVRTGGMGSPGDPSYRDRPGALSQS